MSRHRRAAPHHGDRGAARACDGEPLAARRDLMGVHPGEPGTPWPRPARRFARRRTHHRGVWRSRKRAWFGTSRPPVRARLPRQGGVTSRRTLVDVLERPQRTVCDAVHAGSNPVVHPTTSCRQPALSEEPGTVTSVSRFRLVPDAQQATALMGLCDQARYVWNLGLEQRKHYRPGRASSPGFAEQCRQLTDATGWLSGL
jgi:hypothetical protein